MIPIIAQKNPGISPHEHGLQLLNTVIKKLYPDLGRYKIVKGENGKPHVAEKPEFHYNISHSRDWTVMAVSGSEIGIDIQYIRPMKSGIEKRFYTRRENLFLESLPANERIVASTKMWTLKEAAVKAIGESLAKRLKELDTIAYDGTWSPIILGQYVYTIPFPDIDYILSCAAAVSIESDYHLTILK